MIRHRISANNFYGNYSFLNLELWKIQIDAANFNILPNKLNFCFGNYSREENIQGQKLFSDIRYLIM